MARTTASKLLSFSSTTVPSRGISSSADSSPTPPIRDGTSSAGAGVRGDAAPGLGRHVGDSQSHNSGDAVGQHVEVGLRGRLSRDGAAHQCDDATAEVVGEAARLVDSFDVAGAGATEQERAVAAEMGCAVGLEI